MSIEKFETALKSKLVIELAAYNTNTLYVNKVAWIEQLDPEVWHEISTFLTGQSYDQYLRVRGLAELEACLIKHKLDVKIRLQLGWWAELIMLVLV